MMAETKPGKTPPFDVIQAHRWFAVEANNAAWDLIEADERPREQRREMVQLAHAAAWHWAHAGSAIHQLRASILLAAAYVAVGEYASALHYIVHTPNRLQATGEATAFDMASAWRMLSNTLRKVGDGKEAATLRKMSDDWAAELTAEEKAVLEKFPL